MGLGSVTQIPWFYSAKDKPCYINFCIKILYVNVFRNPYWWEYIIYIFSTHFIKPDANGEYHLLLCQIILGMTETITQGARQYAPSTEGIDNGIDDYENPKCYVIWTAHMSIHIIPRYFVTFKVSQPSEGKLSSKLICKSFVSLSWNFEF